MGKTLYLECNSGISGDMTVAALLDLGADKAVLEKVLSSIDAKGFRTKISRVKKAGIDCCDFDVILDEEHENHDHDMEYLHGHEHEHSHEHEHGHDHEHGHEHHHHHEHRGMAEIRTILKHCEMTEGARQLAEKIFDILAQAEAKAHNRPIEEVHFHEVGAIDSIVDIVAAAVCIDNLNITNVIVPKLCEGSGTIRCQHGILPIPVPATANIVSEYKLPIEVMDVQGEFVTPTGAAIVAAVCSGRSLPKQMTIEKIGLGAGKRNYEKPSILRAMLIQAAEETEEEKDVIWKLETNIDDSTGEALGHVMELLFKAGARDVHYMPVYMKKNRPAWQLNVICDEKDIEKLEYLIFKETTTIGIRRVKMERSVLPREQMLVHTDYGEAMVKVCSLGKEKRYYPEYDSVVRMCLQSGKSYQEMYRELMHICEKK